MGAATSFRAARAQPARVEGLLHVVPALRDRPHAAIFLFDALADVVRDGGLAALEQNLRHVLANQTAPTDDIFLEQLRTHDAASLEVALRAVSRWILDDVPAAFSDLPFPVLVLGWDDDPVHPLQDARDVADAAGVDLIEIDRSALDVPERLGRVLVGAISRVAA